MSLRRRIVLLGALAAGCAMAAGEAPEDAAGDGALSLLGADAAVASADGAPAVDAPPPPPDAEPPPPPPPPDACVPAWTQLLANPGFESGAAGWSQTGSVITDEAAMPIPAQAGTWAAWLAGANSTDDRLSQEVTVPASATALRVRGWQCFVTADLAGDDDHFTAELRSAGGTTLETLHAVGNLGVGTVCGWTELEWNAAAAHAGETIQLFFRGTTDGSYPTSFYLDSLALEAFACP